MRTGLRRRDTHPGTGKSARTKSSVRDTVTRDSLFSVSFLGIKLSTTTKKAQLWGYVWALGGVEGG